MYKKRDIYIKLPECPHGYFAAQLGLTVTTPHLELNYTVVNILRPKDCIWPKYVSIWPLI